jgi:hypothetical protein
LCKIPGGVIHVQGDFVFKTKPAITFAAIGLVMLACTSVSQFVGMPNPNDPGLDPKDVEDDSMSADATLSAGYRATETAEGLAAEPVQDTDELGLTSEEEVNSGQHFYVIEGSGEPLLGGSDTYSGEGFATSNFEEGGVTFNLSEQAPERYIKIGPNTYLNGNGTIKVIYTSTGFEMQLDVNGWVYTYTLSD